MRIVFFGTPELAVPSLAALAGRHAVAAVVCQPDKPQGRSAKLVPPPAKVWADGHGIPVVQPTKLNDGTFEAWLRQQAPDLCALAAYGRILKQPILNVPRHGFLNVHPSLLPKLRGPSPIQTALLQGLTATGVTIMRLDAGMDTGDILLQEEAAIAPDDTTASLMERLARQGADMLLRAIELVESGAAVFTPQDHAQATVSRMYSKDDGRIQWASSAADIHNLVRAAVPWPVAHCLFRGEIHRIHRTAVLNETAEAAPGTIVRVEKDRLVTATGNGLLAILEIQRPGKRAMSVREFLLGCRVADGEAFSDCAS